jgi:hypothetical protein|tara:strand:- start:332 stop:505 length:174 start_codon:yes stop_codon:yes gene_type:complete
MRLIFYFPRTSNAAVAKLELGDLWLEIKIIPLIDQKTDFIQQARLIKNCGGLLTSVE